MIGQSTRRYVVCCLLTVVCCLLTELHCYSRAEALTELLSVQDCDAVPEYVKGQRYWGNRECTVMFDCATGVCFDDHDLIDQFSAPQL